MILNITKIDETLIYYDRPLLFTVFDNDGRIKYLVTLAEENEDGSEIWICAPISDDMLRAVKAGEYDLLMGFAGRPAIALRQIATGEVSEEVLDDVPDEWLPLEGARLGRISDEV